MKYLFTIIFCLLLIGTGALASEENSGVKTLLDKYAKAYSGNDVDTMRKILIGKALKSYQTDFLRYRRDKIKPKLEIKFNRSFKKGNKVIVDTNVTLVNNNSTVYKNRKTEFVIVEKNKADKITEVITQDLKKISNYLDAVQAADVLAVFKINKADSKEKSSYILPNKKYKAEFISVLGKDQDDRKINYKLPPEWIYSYCKEGMFVIPLTAENNIFVPVGRTFYLVEFIEEDKKITNSVLNEWRTKGNSCITPANIKNTSVTKGFKPVHIDVIKKLKKSGYFNKDLTDSEVKGWLDFIKDKNISSQIRSTVLKQLALNNYKKIKNFLYDNLNDKALSLTCASLLLEKDKNKFTEKMVAWLDDPQKQNLAVKFSGFLSKDKAFVDKLKDNKSIWENKDNHVYLLPIMLSNGNQDYNEHIKKIINENSNPDSTASLIKGLTYTKNNKFLPQIIELVSKLPGKDIQQRGNRMLVMSCLNYFNSLDDRKYIEQFIKDLLNSKNKKSVILASVNFALHKRFKNIEDLNRWIDTGNKN